MNPKSSIYDFFAMVIPGFLWLLLISFCCKWNFTFAGYGIDGIIGGTMLFIACYTIGLVYHKLVELMTNKWFRNNRCCIRKSWEKFCTEYKKDNDKKENSQWTKGNRHDYFKAYYTLMKEGMLGSIPVLEAQVAFLRNLVLITVAYTIKMYCCSWCWCCLSISPCSFTVALIILLVLMVVALISIQNKIYYLVWEGYEYLVYEIPTIPVNRSGVYSTSTPPPARP
ncbi:MAG: hypothetical protein LBT61_03330 [Prevotellaceae bacterium]|jgi:hypothetical protein|nr:hypothetical protein [Prevotellaceae bacterium]